MAAPVPVVLDFKLKKDLMAYVRSALAELGPTPDLERADPELHAFFLELFRSHPRCDAKLGQLASVAVVRSGWSGKGGDGAAYGFVLSYEGDKPADDISWRKCVSNSGVGVRGRAAKRQSDGGSGSGSGAKSAKDGRCRFMVAMRQAVSGQISSFSASAHLDPSTGTCTGACAGTCTSCGARGDGVRFHVDHSGEGSSFAQLVSAFLHGRADVPDGTTGVADAPELLHRHRFRDEHEAFVREWQSYHMARARLQLVCVRCNLVTLNRERNFPHLVAPPCREDSIPLAPLEGPL